MKTAAPLLAAGGTFAATALIGLFAGAALARHSGQPMWAFAGLLLGLGIGGYAAVRLLMRAIS
ncbi:MAG TPA: AtpZ/AtpI family protein [Candidatus Baltobacteraceae bacterium]|jgi:hypothetical protein|nr:AtpZ/AtpI family protein [Candidatus Baltobacteraceae bacterium]